MLVVGGAIAGITARYEPKAIHNAIRYGNR